MPLLGFLEFTALVVGVAALMVGAGVIAGADLLADGLWHSTLAYLQRRPAPALAAGGVLAACAGLFLMMNPSGRVGTAWTPPRPRPARPSGLRARPCRHRRHRPRRLGVAPARGVRRLTRALPRRLHF